MILFLDTSTPECKLTLIDDATRHDASWQADRTLARDLLGYLEQRLAEAGSTMEQLTGIGLMTGPGSFTGLRIGMAVCNTLADALQIPIVGTRGDAWQQAALDRLTAGETDKIVLPFYGGDAHITKPRK
jgi:tRNA threonylcarbamoyladenosine biosynthesis protein TsaB